MNSTLRLLLSSAVAFAFYFGWTYWANSAPEIEAGVQLRAALVQGAYSGFVTLFFTFLLEKTVQRFHAHCLSLAFMTPILCSVHSKSRQNLAIYAAFNDGLDTSARYLEGKKLPGALVAPLLPLFVQSCLVVLVNILNGTPNLWLTVTPSILFTGLYGYFYTFALLKGTSLNSKKS